MKIRSKFLIIFMLLVLFLTLGGILLNSLFLESYYISKNKDFLIHEGNLIKEEYLSDNDNIENYIFTEARSHGTNIFILDNNSNVVYTSIDLKSSKAKKFIPHIKQNNYYENKHDISKQDVKYIEKDKNNEDDTKLMYTVNLDDVKELLDYTMMDDGLTQLHISDFHIKDFLYKISDRFKYIFTQNNIKFNIDCKEDCLISADTQMIEKAINNFITNAIKYVDDKRIISLTDKIINNDTLKISVFNSGQNIPNTELDKIWDVCYKVDKSRTRELGGHGIGLSFVKLIAQLHNGTYYVENNNDGVTFSLEIPIKYCEK